MLQYVYMYIQVLCMVQDYKRRNFFWWGQPSPIDIVNWYSVGKGSKKRIGILQAPDWIRIRSLLTIFDKQFYNSVKIGPYFFLQHFKAKLIYNFVKFCGWDQFKNPDFYPTFQQSRAGEQAKAAEQAHNRDKPVLYPSRRHRCDFFVRVGGGGSGSGVY